MRISGAGDAEKRRATDRLAELARTDLVPGARLYVLAGALRDQFGDDVLAEAARALRESAKG